MVVDDDDDDDDADADADVSSLPPSFSTSLLYLSRSCYVVWYVHTVTLRYGHREGRGWLFDVM